MTLQKNLNLVEYLLIGVWRSLVARSAGGREVAGSNPVTPIFCLKIRFFEKGVNVCLKPWRNIEERSSDTFYEIISKDFEPCGNCHP